jgi:hypothetical protein
VVVFPFSGLSGLYADFAVESWHFHFNSILPSKKTQKEAHQFIHSCLTRTGSFHTTKIGLERLQSVQKNALSQSLLRHEHLECSLTQEFAAGLVQEYGPFSVVVANILRGLRNL